MTTEPSTGRTGVPTVWQWFLEVLYKRTTLVLTLIFCAGVGLAFWHFSRLSSELIESSARQSSPEYSQILRATRAFYTSDVAGRARGHGTNVTANYKAIPGAIPIPTTFTLELGERLSSGDNGIKVRLYSQYPWPQRRRTGGPHDTYEREALKYLTHHPGGEYVRFENYQGRPSIRYSTADIMLLACVSCHNSRPDSPKRDWHVGDVRGVLEVVRPLDDVVAQTNRGLRGTFLLIFVFGLVGLGSLSLVIGKFRRNSEELEGRVLSRTEDLSLANGQLQANIAERAQVQAQLEVAKEEADSANRSKSAFLATMSHEIRTPMNAVIGMSGLLLSTPLNAEQKEFVDLIQHSGDALLGIINDILDFSKIEAGRMELECHALDLGDCIESAFDLVAIRAGEKGLELICDSGPSSVNGVLPVNGAFPDEVPHAILGDVTRLRQVITNLLTNAVKFTESGEIVLSVSARRLEAHEVVQSPVTACDIKNQDSKDGPANPRYELHFEVKDTGIGIPPERMDRLFKSFSQVDASTTRKYGGSGLGLTISKRLCEMMGGTMWAESDGTGQGSTFAFTVRAEAVEMAPRPHRQPGAQPHLEGKRVLIVDDNATNRRILTLQAASWGMATRATHSPHEALQWIRRGDPFDVAILDFQMPEMDGLMLAHEIRRLSDSRAHELPLIMCTSLGRRLADVESIDWAAFLTKPVKSSQMYDALATLFIEERAEDAARSGDGLRPEVMVAERVPLRILVAEDNAVNQKVIQRLLAHLDYRADIAGNGLEAIQALERQQYDVVLMDVQMPEMDGLEASRRICRQWPRGQRPRIVAMTANAMQGDREMCLQAGMDDYLSKPVRSEELAAALLRCQPMAPIPGITPGVGPNPGAAETPAAGERATNGAIDEQVFARFSESMGQDFMPELIEAYLSDSQALVGQMQAAMQNADDELARRAAHTLKSNSASFGALTLAGLCREMEEIGLSGTPNEAARRVENIALERDKVGAALKKVSNA